MVKTITSGNAFGGASSSVDFSLRAFDFRNPKFAQAEAYATKTVLSSTTVNATPLTPSEQNKTSAMQAEFRSRPSSNHARPEIHKTVAAILDPLPRGKLLDVPAGEGALSARLAEAGFDVRACDLYPEIFRVHRYRSPPRRFVRCIAI